MKIETDIAKKQYQKGNKVYEFDEKINKNVRKPALKKYNKSDLKYNANHSFYKNHDIRKFDNLSLESKYSFLVNFFIDLDKFNNLKTLKKRKRQMCIIHSFKPIS